MLNLGSIVTLPVDGGTEYEVEYSEGWSVYYLTAVEVRTANILPFNVVRTDFGSCRLWPGQFKYHILADTLSELEEVIEKVRPVLAAKSVTHITAVLRAFGFGCQTDNVKKLCTILVKDSQC